MFRKTISFLRIINNKYIYLFILLGIFYSFIYILQYYIPLCEKNLIDNAIRTKNVFNNYLYYLIYIQIGYIVILLSTKILYGKFHLHLEKELFFHFFKRVIYLRKSYIQKEGTGHYYDILAVDLDGASSIFNFLLFDLIASSIQAAFIFLLFWKWSKTLVLIYGIVFIISIFLSYIGAKLERYIYSNMRKSSTNLAAAVIDALSNNNIIKHFLVFFNISKRVERKYNSYQKFSMLHAYYLPLPTALISILKMVTLIATIIYTVSLVINNQLSYGTMIAIIVYASLIFSPLDNFMAFILNIRGAEIGISRVLNIYDKGGKSLEQRNNNIIKLSNNIALLVKDLSFRYDEKSDYILKNLSFNIKSGKKVGFVGLSGEGKSSLLKLLYKENEIIEGHIEFYGTDINDFAYSNYFHYINVFPQESEIFNQDVVFNIALGKKPILACKKDKTIFEIRNMFEKQLNNCLKYQNYHFQLDEIRETFEMMGILHLEKEIIRRDYEYILNELTSIHFHKTYVTKEKLDNVIKKTKLEKFYGRPLGEGGAFISGGEKQRVILARFLLNEHYRFFIIDEPFTSLDIISEKEMINLLKEDLKDKTGIVISHKFNVLHALSDEFFVLKDGMLIETGTHKELYKKDSFYRKILKTYIEENRID